MISHLKTCFERHGIPDTVIADNVTLWSNEFGQFAEEWGFEVKTSSPHHAPSNWQSERSVGTIKQLMRKSAEGGRDIHLALLAHRNTLISGLEYSPAQLLMSRMLKERLPTATSLLSPKVAQGVHRSLLARQQRQNRYHDRGTTALPTLQIGVLVTVQQGRTWNPEIVVEKHEAPRSFKVKTEDGQIFRRNRRFLCQSVEAEHAQPDQATLPATPTEDQVAHPVNHAFPSTSPEKIPVEATSPVGLPVSTPQAPKTRVSERQRNKPKWLDDYEHWLSRTMLRNSSILYIRNVICYCFQCHT